KLTYLGRKDIMSADVLVPCLIPSHQYNTSEINHTDACHQCGPHGKEVDYAWPRQSMVAKQGYEAKMNSSDQSMQK
ncbi:hypothetical protein L9F63_007318, partial [Diploptera punctata]